jgi:hypothetical protein
LHFNHHFGFVEQKSKRTPQVWVASLGAKPVEDNNEMAESVRDSLGLMGWTIPWNMQRTPEGDLRFDLERPGKSYTIQTDIKKQTAQVQERRKSFWQVLNSMHALGAVPNSRFVRWWGGYTEVCTAFVLFGAFSGIYLWLNSKRERQIGLLLFFTATVLSFALMFVVVRWG